MLCLNPTKLVYDFDEKKYFSSPHFRFVSQVVLKLLKNNCIEELDQKYYCCNSKQNKFPYDNLTASSEILSKFLGFQWTFKDGSTIYFQFCVLPFCLSSAGYVFAKVLCPFTKRWNSIGIIYIDDGIAASRTFELAKTAYQLAKNDCN